MKKQYFLFAIPAAAAASAGFFLLKKKKSAPSASVSVKKPGAKAAPKKTLENRGIVGFFKSLFGKKK